MPSDVFVSMAFGREGSEEAWKVIRKACKEFGLEARRAHQNHFPGSPAIDEAIEALVDLCDFAVIDLTHERPSVAHEIGLCDREFDRAFTHLRSIKSASRSPWILALASSVRNGGSMQSARHCSPVYSRAMK